MGNVAMVCGGRPGGSTEPAEPRSPVTVLQSNGNVLSLCSSRIRVVDLILDYPNHFVCHSSSLVLLHHSKILPLHTLLVPGEVYFLLPMPNNRPHNHQDNESDTSSLLHIEPPRRATTGSSTKFVISTEQFSRIMAGSLVKDGKGSSSSSSGKRNRHHGRSGSSSKATTMTTKGMSSSSGGGNSITAPIAAPWRPALSSIEEVAAN